MSIVFAPKPASKFIMLTAIGVLSTHARATTVQDLQLSCGGHYKVLSSEPYFYDNTGTRAPSFAGTHEQIQVLDVSGKDCQTIAESYSVTVKSGQVLAFGESTGESFAAAKKLAAQRSGQTFAFSAQQEFVYAEKDGTLPLFPLIHTEAIYLLNMSGTANVKQLYGTPDKSELSDKQLLALTNKVMAHIDYGKIYQTISWGDAWLDLALNLKPNDLIAQKEYASTITLLFQNVSKYDSFSTASPAVKVGQALNVLLNDLGATKWQTKMDVWKHHPMLFQDQIVSWARFEGTPAVKAPLLPAAEIEEFLVFAFEQVKALKVVNWVEGVQSMISQFQQAAASIEANSLANGSLPPVYILTPKAQDLITQIHAF